MEATPRRVFTIPPEADFLAELANAVLGGFPLEPRQAPDPLTELPRWTILLPTRRAARQLEQVFFGLLGGKGSLLPRIRPIGDIDEDLLSASAVAGSEAAGVPDAISPIGRELALMSLIDEWARDNPQALLAREIAGSAEQTLGLAVSLAEFIDALETEQIDPAEFPKLFDREAARHREAILGFLGLARERLPGLLHDRKLLGPVERRSRIIRHEARRLASAPARWPIIAAGSTGTIPATRDLLQAIASVPLGAVVLPGLDLGLDDESWNLAGPQHPQYALKQLLQSFRIARQEVSPLTPAKASPRQWLASEFMRPPETSDRWQEVIAKNQPRLARAGEGLAFVEAADREEEAAIIAIMLREVLADSTRTAALITPDRDLARRVKQELRRWAIAIDDTAGEPLISFSGPALLGLLIDAVQSNFSAAALNALIRHPLASFGTETEVAHRAAEVIELALFRFGAGPPDLRALPAVLERNRTAIAADSHAHSLLQRISDEDWTSAARYLDRVIAALSPLEEAGEADLKVLIDRFTMCLDAIAVPALWSDEPGLALQQLLEILRAEAGEAGACSRDRLLNLVLYHLRTIAFRQSLGQTPRLAIYGLLEARLMRADIHILGGLNEGIWPALPDSGPWLNRPMRSILNMQLPERAIGQTAHDLVQAMGASDVRFTWSRRMGDSPANPSRWILRLRMLLSMGGDGKDMPPTGWHLWARQLKTSNTFTPVKKPRPAPAAEARPKSLSVTRIETLIRDPYAIYARHVLGLEPLDAISMAPDARLRGTLIHDAIGKFLQEARQSLPSEPLQRLLDFGRTAFAPYGNIPLVSAFWWPRFERIAAWLIEQEREDRLSIIETLAEVGGALTLDLPDGTPFRLTCRADRIDILKEGLARIIDYKTGTPPSGPEVNRGISPQLTLEAAMLAHGAFKGVTANVVSEIAYVKLSGGDPAGAVDTPKLDAPIMEFAEGQLEKLVALLGKYQSPHQPYYPRALVEKVDDVSDYDHLSRYREWLLSGAAS